MSHNWPEYFKTSTIKGSRSLPGTNRARTWPCGRVGATWGQQIPQGSNPDSPPFDGEHHAEENNNKHEEASDHSGHLHSVVHLLLWLHSVRILGGGTLAGKGEGERC